MKPRLLIAVADTDLARTFERFFAKRGHQIELAPTMREGLSLIADEEPCCGAIVDRTFPDGDGLALLDAFHTRRPAAPTLMLIATPDRDVLNRAFILGASSGIKPVPDDVLLTFWRRLAEARDRAVSCAALEVARAHGLTAGETFLLLVTVRGVSRDELPARLEIADSTVRARIRSVARKCDDMPFVDVVQAARHRAERLAGWTWPSVDEQRNAGDQLTS